MSQYSYTLGSGFQPVPTTPSNTILPLTWSYGPVGSPINGSVGHPIWNGQVTFPFQGIDPMFGMDEDFLETIRSQRQLAAKAARQELAEIEALWRDEDESSDQ